MSRYIDAGAIVDRVCEGISCNECSFGTNEDGMSECVLDKRIAELPTADVVEVVRCRECDVPHNKWLGCPNLNGMIPPPDFYCAKGKRKAKNADRDGEPFGNLHNAFVERSKK